MVKRHLLDLDFSKPRWLGIMYKLHTCETGEVVPFSSILFVKSSRGVELCT